MKKYRTTIKWISTLLISGMLLVGCKDKTQHKEVDLGNVEVKTRSFQIRSLLVTVNSNTLPVNSTVTFEVFAETEALFDDSQEITTHSQPSSVNISALSEITFVSTDPEILYISEKERTGFARKEGSVTVYANFRGVQSAPQVLEVLPR
ncbi:MULTISPECIES: hypothetical protein [unclassified Vibrio]|uniref:hypothetical protein n=1 Tax=Vibrio TaxID=662 RepID=UPI00119279A4|nr:MULTISPECIES: hypothetical protein [unclassified Vibrio]TVU67896.1 hypothetical protein FQP87_23455 [Vibrio tasmaniensis]CAH7089054.1 conserved hypothetical protein [Vibrio chagasii]MCF7507169.1 hypothetical protein [Vibrio sp. L3-7]NOI88750.1 hypothetical protein [Vibrio sp. 99K-1]CAH7260519.1 conserved hypothetical protein [Vibrio chagasii]